MEINSVMDRQQHLAEIKKDLEKMREIATWSNSHKSFLAFPPPNGEYFISLSCDVLTHYDKLLPSGHITNNELGDIRILYSQIASNMAQNNEEACYPLCNEMVGLMKRFISTVEEALSIKFL